VRNITLPFAVCALAMLGSCQTPEQREAAANAYFPAEMEDNVWINLAKFREPNLFTESDSSFQSRYRLSISGISCTSYVIRIDERVGGKLTGKVNSRNKCNNEPAELRSFRPSVDDFVELKSRIDAANMFKFYPEVWTKDVEDLICLDGNMLVFERRSSDGYAVSSANAQCEAPAQLHAVAQQFVKMSGAKGASGLLR
jgi:hypothetical protein